MKQVLYVDDEEINLFIFRQNFKDRFGVSTSISAQEALDTLSLRNDIEVVVSDMRMPGMDGLTFIKKARELRPNVNYFLLTGYDVNEPIQEALTSGMVKTCFSKPLDIDLIEEAISST